MAIVACYSMDLYCDSGRHSNYELNMHCLQEGPNFEDSHGAHDEYMGETYTQCAKAAKKIGWYLSRDRTKALCPYCNPKSKHYIKNLKGDSDG